MQRSLVRPASHTGSLLRSLGALRCFFENPDLRPEPREGGEASGAAPETSPDLRLGRARSGAAAAPGTRARSAVERLKQAGFNPKRILDIGAHKARDTRGE